MIEELLSEPVVGADSFDSAQDTALFPEEETWAAPMATARRAKFTTIRDCARQAMVQLGLPPAPILRGRSGEPVWPSGLTGSMTHTRGYHAAAVASSRDILAIGVDAEPNQRLRNPDVLPLVSLAAERAWVETLLDRRPEVAWDRLLFSAKESVYKACFPLVGPLGFDDALITVDPRDGTFRARVRLPGPTGQEARSTRLTGRWLARDGLIVTAMVLRRPPPRRRLRPSPDLVRVAGFG
ncbi:4'-phosphopantetheinyl transferase superfamily protein [Kitasatospora sp. NPDC005856]|uniref:4'-phosphopantetheinyl transferase family protein n=1 Tax=Kitasatospora sp. NPDC005856 TaxID=3154566 RepID=UPI0033FC3CEC